MSTSVSLICSEMTPVLMTDDMLVVNSVDQMLFDNFDLTLFNDVAQEGSF